MDSPRHCLLCGQFVVPSLLIVWLHALLHPASHTLFSAAFVSDLPQSFKSTDKPVRVSRSITTPFRGTKGAKEQKHRTQ